MAIKVFHRDAPDIMLPIISKDARLVVWPGVGAESANMNYVILEPGEANIPHLHAESEDSVFILEGKGSVQDFDNDRSIEFEAGQIVHVPVGIRHAISADRGERLVSAGGPSPADRALLRAAGALKDD